MKTLNWIATLLACLFIAAGPMPLMAQDLTPAQKYELEKTKAGTPTSSWFSGAGLGAGLGAALTLVGAGYGFGKIGSSALESMARQPEVAGQINTSMITAAALIEGATFFALIIVILQRTPY
jgi:F-type H+-transporting ATPase subunit c